MSKESGVILLGLFVAILPFLGFPQSVRDIFFMLSGLGALALGLFLRADHLKREASANGMTQGIQKGAPQGVTENGLAQRISDISPVE